MKIVGSRTKICSAEGVRRGGSAGVGGGGGGHPYPRPPKWIRPWAGGGVQLDFQRLPVGRQNETQNGAKMVPKMKRKMELEIHYFLFNFKKLQHVIPKLLFLQWAAELDDRRKN